MSTPPAAPDRVQAALDRINAVQVQYSRYKHPLWKGLMEGHFERHQVREFLKQASIIPLYNHLYHGPLYVNCPDPEWREMIAEVVYEEGTGRLFANGSPHWKLWLRLGNVFGIADDEMWNADLCPEAIAYRAFCNRICSGDFLEGVSAHMLGAEAQVPGAVGSVAQGLKKKFNLSDYDLAFYIVHNEADAEHADIGRRLLGRFAKSEADLERAITAATQMVLVSQVMFDGVHRCVLRVR
ncbi:MAG: TenA family transcriptional regulator [Burkholderiales bacterium]